MGTSSIIIVRERRHKNRTNDYHWKEATSPMNGPTESQYFYYYYTCIYQRCDGHVECGVGEWLINFLCEFKSKLSETPRSYIGFLTAMLIKASLSMSEYQRPSLLPISSLKEIFKYDYEFAYIITYEMPERQNVDEYDRRIMLSVYQDKDFILTTYPSEFLEKYQYYKTQMEELKKSFADIDYDDNDVEKRGFLSEDQLLLKFLKQNTL